MIWWYRTWAIHKNAVGYEVLDSAGNVIVSRLQYLGDAKDYIDELAEELQAE